MQVFEGDTFARYEPFRLIAFVRFAIHDGATKLRPFYASFFFFATRAPTPPVANPSRALKTTKDAPPNLWLHIGIPRIPSREAFPQSLLLPPSISQNALRHSPKQGHTLRSLSTLRRTASPFSRTRQHNLGLPQMHLRTVRRLPFSSVTKVFLELKCLRQPFQSRIHIPVSHMRYQNIRRHRSIGNHPANNSTTPRVRRSLNSPSWCWMSAEDG
jgi:hypothetical protein